MRAKRTGLPLVLQMPITSRCNSKCKTCNVWKWKSSNDIDCVGLKAALQDPFFSEVRSVGLNGGEFTLVPNFMSVLDSVLVLPKLSGLYLISNGLFPKRLFEYLCEAKQRCKEKNVWLNICISIDGVGAVHETVRGIPNCFSRSKEILDELYKNKECYCDSFSVGCTLSKYNIGFVREIEAFFSQYDGLSVEYHLAVPNKRIGTFNDYEDYYVLNDEKSRLLATEFFFERFKTSWDEHLKRQSFVNYYFLKNKGHGRLCGCDYLSRDVTIDENLDMSLCATASDVIGNLKEFCASDIIKSRKRKVIQKYLKKQCDSCVHYSYYPLTFKGLLAYIHAIMSEKYAMEYYDACSHKQWKRRLSHRCSLAKRFLYDYSKLLYRYLWKLR